MLFVLNVLHCTQPNATRFRASLSPITSFTLNPTFHLEHRHITPEMALFKRQAPTTYGILDDQGSVVIGYMGNWTHVTGSEWLMNTCSCTTTPQSSYSLTFVGT